MGVFPREVDVLRVVYDRKKDLLPNRPIHLDETRLFLLPLLNHPYGKRKSQVR